MVDMGEAADAVQRQLRVAAAATFTTIMVIVVKVMTVHWWCYMHFL